MHARRKRSCEAHVSDEVLTSPHTELCRGRPAVAPGVSRDGDVVDLITAELEGAPRQIDMEIRHCIDRLRHRG